MSGIGPIDHALLPADVRDGTKADREKYTAALSFERQLVSELAKQLAETAKPADDAQGSAATQTYRAMLPDTMADAVIGAGGLGIARSVYDSLKAGEQ